jgi:hypothetical protein
VTALNCLPVSRTIRVAAILAAALALAPAATGGSPAAARPTPYCTREAGWIADGALQVLHHYDHDVYPADVALIGLQTSVKQYRLHRCADRVLRDTLLHRLTRKQRTRLLEILPNDLVRYFRGVLAS